MCQRWILVEQIFTSVVSRARGNARKRQTGPPQNMWCFSMVFQVATCDLWDCENWTAKHFERWNWQISPRSSDPQTWKSSQPLLRKTPLWPTVTKMPRTSLALGQAWRDRGVGGCEKTAVHKLEVCFCKILTRSNYRCGQRWGLLERIFISESRKLTSATG